MAPGPLSADQLRLLQRRLDEAGVGAAPAPIPRRPAGETRSPASPAQERLFFFERMNPGSPLYVVAGALRMHGELDLAVLRETVRRLVDRHEALRTGLEVDTDGAVVQVVHPPEAVPVELPVREVTADELWDEVGHTCRRPFDLAGPSLLRPALFRVGPAEWYLVLCVHHIVVDGWSLGVLAEEFAVVYGALRGGQLPVLRPLPIRYADFAAWHRDHVSGDALAGQVEYWREQLAGVRPFALPADVTSGPGRPFSGGDVPMSLPADLVDGMRRLGEAEGATLYMVLATAWAVVLSRWADRSDVVWGTAIAARTRTELEGLVGFFVNTLALRVDVRAPLTFRELLGRVRRTCLDAYAHQDLPFDQLVKVVRPDRDATGRSPVVRHLLVLHNTPPATAQLPGISMDVVPVHTGTAKFELEIELSPAADGGLTGFVEFAADVLAESSVRRLVGALTEVLRAGVADAGCPVWRLPLAPVERHAQVGRMHLLDRSLTEVPAGVVGQVFVSAAEAGEGFAGRPGRTAERFVPDPTGSGTRLYATGLRARRTAAGALEFLAPAVDDEPRQAVEHPVEPRQEKVATRTETERVVAGIWAELLDADDFGVHDDFFDLGGHSLLAVRILHRIHAACHVELELVDFFEAGTVANVAALVEKATPARPTRSIPKLDRARFRADDDRSDHGAE
ncbi:condensation domain-containing protein [Lentzea sp. NPDC042327]|uniref:condensation domain-containing protein n=1 Tax=Lentzea sp. NPDC042327 TaxID=3154801 RepID=UPI0033D1EB12